MLYPSSRTSTVFRRPFYFGSLNFTVQLIRCSHVAAKVSALETAYLSVGLACLRNSGTFSVVLADDIPGLSGHQNPPQNSHTSMQSLSSPIITHRQSCHIPTTRDIDTLHTAAQAGQQSFAKQCMFCVAERGLVTISCLFAFRQDAKDDVKHKHMYRST